MRRVHGIITAVVAAIAVTGAGPASATFPGENGEIAYWRYAKDRDSLRTIYLDGTLGRVLWPPGEEVGSGLGTAFPFDVEWSPDGERVAYVAVGHTLGDDHVLIGDPGTGDRTVIFEPGTFDAHAYTASIAFSPASDSLMLCIASIGRANTSRLYTIDVDGSNVDLVSEQSRCFADWNASDRIVATAGADNRRLITMAPDGSDVRTVVPKGRHLWWPSWSPDGSRIVYTAVVGPRERFELFSVGSDGTSRIRLTDTPRRDEARPLYSPDGSSIVYSRSREYWDDSDLFAIAVDGSGVRRLTDTPRAYEEPRSFQPLP